MCIYIFLLVSVWIHWAHALSFHSVDPEDWIQVASLYGQCSYPLVISLTPFSNCSFICSLYVFSQCSFYSKWHFIDGLQKNDYARYIYFNTETGKPASLGIRLFYSLGTHLLRNIQKSTATNMNNTNNNIYFCQCSCCLFHIGI